MTRKQRHLLTRIIVAAVLFGFGIQMNGGPETKTAQFLEDITGCIMKTVKLITYYAPIGFFGFFANLVATYGPELVKDYSRTLIIYYVMSFAYMFVFFPIYARFGGGKGGAKVMLSKLFRPAAVSFGTCSSVATIPTNMEVAEETGVSRDVSDIVLPLGATMHMDGSAMSAIIKVAFLFGVFGLDFSTDKAILAIIVAVFSSVAMSGIPGGGGTGELVVCTIFFPDQLAIAYPIALAIGNLVDRIRMREVVDFLDFYFRDAHWPAFNIADVGICVGAGLTALAMLLGQDREDNGASRRKKEKDA